MAGGVDLGKKEGGEGRVGGVVIRETFSRDACMREEFLLKDFYGCCS